MTLPPEEIIHHPYYQAVVHHRRDWQMMTKKGVTLWDAICWDLRSFVHTVQTRKDKNDFIERFGNDGMMYINNAIGGFFCPHK